MDIKLGKFDVKATCGTKHLLTAVRPAYAFINGNRAAEPHGYVYTTVLPDRRFAELETTIEGPPLMEVSENCVEVSFTGLELQIKWSPVTKANYIGATATGIAPVPTGKA